MLGNVRSAHLCGRELVTSLVNSFRFWIAPMVRKFLRIMSPKSFFLPLFQNVTLIYKLLAHLLTQSKYLKNRKYGQVAA